MPRLTLLAATLALALPCCGAAALAQGVAPGGGIGNSTGIGSGLGTPGGTGPSYPNGTTAPTLAPSPPPGGAPFSSPGPAPRGPALSTMRPSYPQPTAPFESSGQRAPATVPLSLPETPPADLSLLKGCWRTDVFQQAQHVGMTTYCFDDKGVGRFLYTRQDQPSYSCHGSAQAGYAGPVLHMSGGNTSCSDGADQAPNALDCRASGEAAECTGTAAGGGKVRLYRVR
jgi:hypothetical protein